MALPPAIIVSLGAIAVAVIGIAGASSSDGTFARELQQRADAAIAEQAVAVEADFTTAQGWPTRHPTLTPAGDLNEAARASIAQTIAALPGVGGVQWSDGTVIAEAGAPQFSPLHCQEDVEALLRARTIRFEEGSSRLDAGSADLLDEVAAALRPCLGSIIAITGHTDSSGPEAGNLALSGERASAVEDALIERGIPSDGLRARGIGSQEPVDGLDPTDPANRRIEFSVIATEPLVPTPIDTPGAR